MGYDYKNKSYNYELSFEKLPLFGELSKKPWTGDYWPTYRGGISYRWNTLNKNNSYDTHGYKLLRKKDLKSYDLSSLSPSEKYDLYRSDYRYRTTRSERYRTKILKTIESSPYYDPSYVIPEWEGLCHAWAPATILFENPKPIVLTNKEGISIPFGSSDIKALLTYFLHKKRATTQLLGGRCNIDIQKLKEQLNNKEITLKEYRKAINSDDCRDTNAGSFHLVLTNQIALKDEGFIIDVTKDFEVWNQPVYSFTSKVYNRRNRPSQGAAKDAVREVDVMTKISYVVEVDQTWDYEEKTELKSITYYYCLEINSKGEIVGGRWYNNGSIDDRPDFLWKQSLPEFSSDFKELRNIYQASLKSL